MTVANTLIKTEELLYQLQSLARQAGKNIMRVYHQGNFDVQQKKDNSPVTLADRVAHETIVQGLHQLTPDIPVLSEESEQIPFKIRAQWPTYWLVDPLDGTRHFIARTKYFSVNIALINNHKPIIGVIYLPVADECFYAAQGSGAFISLMKENKVKKIHCRPMNTQKPIITVSGKRKMDKLNACLKNLKQFDIKYIGSSIKSCLVAQGKVDWYPCLGPTSEWDTAAAQCIVEEAGGSLTDLNNTPLRYNTKSKLLNPWFMTCGDPDYDWQALVPKEFRSN